jgi:hypothetical protein
MSLQEYLGPNLFNDIINKAKADEDFNNFIKQNGATKAKLADKLKLENNALKQGVEHLVNVIDDVAAENELLEKKYKFYEETYGQINEEFIKKNELTVVRTPEKIHAKKVLNKYIQNYQALKNNK